MKKLILSVSILGLIVSPVLAGNCSDGGKKSSCSTESCEDGKKGKKDCGDCSEDGEKKPSGEKPADKKTGE